MRRISIPNRSLRVVHKLLVVHKFRSFLRTNGHFVYFLPGLLAFIETKGLEPVFLLSLLEFGMAKRFVSFILSFSL